MSDAQATGGAGQDGQTTATGTDGNGAQGQPPEWFKSFADEVNGKFTKMGQDLGAVREKVRGQDGRTKSEEGKGNDATSKPSLSVEDLDAAMRLGEVRAQLPEDARAYLEEQKQEKGLSFSATLELAQAIHRFGARPDSNGGAKPPPRGHGAKPPPSTPVLPTTQIEFMEWRKSSPEKANACFDHPDFDFQKLPMR